MISPAEMRAVRTLERAAHLADAEDVERGGVEGADEEPLGPQGLEEDGLAGPGQVGNREIALYLQRKSFDLFL